MDGDVVLLEDLLDLLEEDELFLVHILDLEEVLVEGFELPDLVKEGLKCDTTKHKQLLIPRLQTTTNNRQRYL